MGSFFSIFTDAQQRDSLLSRCRPTPKKASPRIGSVGLEPVNAAWPEF